MYRECHKTKCVLETGVKSSHTFLQTVVQVLDRIQGTDFFFLPPSEQNITHSLISKELSSSLWWWSTLERNSEFVLSSRILIINSEFLWGSFALGFCKKIQIFFLFLSLSFAKWPTLTTESKFYLQGNPSYNVPQGHYHQHRLFWGLSGQDVESCPISHKQSIL